MDERRSELVSRFLDDDLDDVERAEIKARLEDDPELCAEIENMRLLRDAVGSIADGMEVPGDLDRVMEPLRRGAPAPVRRVRPVYRWLGAAAAVVLGVTVAVEMVRRNPEPSLKRTSPARVAEQDDDEIFKLAPLPTAVPSESRPLGATDRLLEEEIVSPEPPEPRALDVVGPLSDDEVSIINGGAVPERERSAGTAEGELEPPEEKKATLDTDGPAVTAAAAAPQSRSNLRVTEEGLEAPAPTTAGPVAGKDRRDKDRRESAAVARPTAVVVNGIEIWAGFSSRCPVGRWSVELEIRDGVIVAIDPPPTGAPGQPIEICRPGGLVGSRVESVTDGVRAAEIVVTPET